MRGIEQEVRQVAAADGANFELDQNLALFYFRDCDLNYLKTPFTRDLDCLHCNHGIIE